MEISVASPRMLPRFNLTTCVSVNKQHVQQGRCSASSDHVQRLSIMREHGTFRNR